MSETIDVLDAQLDYATRSEVVDARDDVLRRIDKQEAELRAAHSMGMMAGIE